MAYMYIKEPFFAPRVKHLVMHEWGFDVTQFTTAAEEYEKMALAKIKAVINIDKLETEAIKDLAMTYVRGKFFQDTSLNDDAKEQFTEFYTSINEYKESNEEMEPVKNYAGPMVF